MKPSRYIKSIGPRCGPFAKAIMFNTHYKVPHIGFMAFRSTLSFQNKQYFSIAMKTMLSSQSLLVLSVFLIFVKGESNVTFIRSTACVGECIKPTTLKTFVFRRMFGDWIEEDEHTTPFYHFRAKGKKRKCESIRNFIIVPSTYRLFKTDFKLTCKNWYLDKFHLQPIFSTVGAI